jgi:hypothetical protein
MKTQAKVMAAPAAPAAGSKRINLAGIATKLPAANTAKAYPILPDSHGQAAALASKKASNSKRSEGRWRSKRVGAGQGSWWCRRRGGEGTRHSRRLFFWGGAVQLHPVSAGLASADDFFDHGQVYLLSPTSHFAGKVFLSHRRKLDLEACRFLALIAESSQESRVKLPKNSKI